MKCQCCGKEIPQGVLRCSCGCIQSESPGHYVPPSKEKIFLAKLGKGGVVALVLILVSFFLFFKTQTPEAELFGKWKLKETNFDRWTNRYTIYEVVYDFTQFSGLKISSKVTGATQTTQTPQNFKTTYKVSNGKLIIEEDGEIKTSDFTVSGNLLEVDDDGRGTFERAGGMTKTSLLLLSIIFFFGSAIYLYKSFKK